MSNQTPEMRQCKVCLESKFVIIDFMHQKMKNVCRECRKMEAREARLKKGMMPGNGWKGLTFAMGRRKDPRDKILEL